MTRLIDGGKIGAEASLNKIFWSELDVRMHETALAPARPARRAAARGAGGAGRRRAGWRATSSRSSGPIYAGTNEIQRNVIAERVLGLPRE